MELNRAFKKVRELLEIYPSGDYSEALLTVLSFAEKASSRRDLVMVAEKKLIRKQIIQAIDDCLKGMN